MGWGFDCPYWPWDRAFDQSCSPGGADILIFLRPMWDRHGDDCRLGRKRVRPNNMFPHFHASRTRRTVWKDLEIMEANENKLKVSGFYCAEQRQTNFCSPSIEKCANFLRTHSWISFAKVSVGGIRFSKDSFLEWSDTRKYSGYHFRSSSFMYIFMSAEIKTILNGTRLQIPPFPQRWNYSLLPKTALLSYLITSAALMFFLFIL